MSIGDQQWQSLLGLLASTVRMVPLVTRITLEQGPSDVCSSLSRDQGPLVMVETRTDYDGKGPLHRPVP